jgi:hypothetical protein
MLRQPFSEALQETSRVLLIGAGGGDDVYGAVPILHDLMRAGKRVHLGGVSFASLSDLPGAVSGKDHPDLFPLTRAHAVEDRYCPEAWLSAWLDERYGYRDPIWALKKGGARRVLAAYEALVRTLEIDAVVLVDGGVDVLLKGDETSIGTPVEDLCSLAALAQISVRVRLITCLGFGTELREGVRHAQVLERVSELIRDGAYLGSASLQPETEAGAAYVEALEFAFAHQKGQKRSHVQSVVLSALRGGFGGSGPDVWVSPLSALFWFFDLAKVARSHLFLEHLLQTETIFEATAIVRECRKRLPGRSATDIPL